MGRRMTDDDLIDELSAAKNTVAALRERLYYMGLGLLVFFSILLVDAAPGEDWWVTLSRVFLLGVVALITWDDRRRWRDATAEVQP